MNLISLIEHTELVLLVAILLPLLIPLNVAFMENWLSFCLGIVMFLSIRPFFNQKEDSSKSWGGVIISILLNYVLLSAAYLLVASLFFKASSNFFVGYILLAMVPPAVSIVPLCYLSKCDIKVADKAIFVGYILALIIIPVSSFFVFGKNFNFFQLGRSLFIIILLPTILAYFSRRVENKLFNYTKIVTSLLLGLIVFITVALNRSTLLDITNPDIIKILFVNMSVIFVLGIGVYYVSRRIVPEEDAIDYSLYATQKNEATGIALALLLFSAQAAIPLVFSIIIQFLFFMVFEKWIISK